MCTCTQCTQEGLGVLVKALGTRSFVPNWFLNFPLLQWELRSRAFLLPPPYVFYFNFTVSIKPLNDTSAPNSYVSVNFSVFFFFLSPTFQYSFSCYCIVAGLDVLVQFFCHSTLLQAMMRMHPLQQFYKCYKYLIIKMYARFTTKIQWQFMICAPLLVSVACS